MLKTGGLVTVRGQSGVYRVNKVSKDWMTATLQRFSASRQQPVGDIIITSPVDALDLYKEDASQSSLPGS
jgi:hypothetical protein